ncbi:hypothetical protein ST37_07700 [Vibrio sp. qd031]|uniref:MFS transporter n=1 Tax=Vibrio sp. qd031 TaxID=1603038 RepID=UPI000A25CA20|nr:MFS transporter [Vibrio sp. qd031]ORT51216.1 hypothetical protein ST37_07700 [Vibrio sp. qd031]
MNKSHLQWCYSIQQGLHWAVVGIMIPILVLMIQSIGMSLQQVGVIMAVYVGTTAVLEIPLGGMADRFGRMRTYQCSLLVNIAGFTALYFATDFTSLIIAASFLGAARAIYSGTLDAWFYDAFKHAGSSTEAELNYHSALARVNVFLTLGLALGSLLGGILPSTNLSADFQHPFQLSILVTIIGNALLLFVTHWLLAKPYFATRGTVAPANATHGVGKTIVQALRHGASHKVVSKMLFTIVGCGVVLMSVENFWQPFLEPLAQQSGYGTALFGIVTALYFLMSALSSIASVTLLRWCKQSHSQLMLYTRILAACTLIGLSLSTHVFEFTALYLLFFFLFTVGNNSEQVVLNDYTPEHFRSTMLSVSSFSVTLGAIGSSLLFGWVSEHYSITLSWMVCAAILSITSLAFVPMKHHLNGVRVN